MATADDIIDIADILGVTFQDDCVAAALKFFPAEAPNDTNIDEVIKKAQENDCELMEINLNNIKHISKQKWETLFNVLKDNNTVEAVSAANCDLNDSIVKMLCDCLESNSTIKQLNLESNSVTGKMVLDIIKSTANTKGLEELKIANQYNNMYLGSAIEYALAEMIPKYPHLVKLGVRLEFRDFSFN
ncbi:tropomodulin-3 [Eurytemora carolleeae]|uniref:tropomodulin-3 n=1 Tax=Eurytemora carolleeae TaxID=1294199 RepID=UPI000C775FD4|nr:tropomodulin-3 [Eurytemora carolleeae]|eukprot:XP_023342622.1 tropomodulin-3-like [Eurytemora affinis]